MSVRLQWLGEGLRFAGGPESGPLIVVDGDGKVGTSPMTTFLIGLSACTAADIVDIAAKMRVRLASLDVQAEGERKPEPPRRYTKLRLVYRIAGVEESDRPKIERAVQLSHEKYCSALHSIREDVAVETDVVFE